MITLQNIILPELDICSEQDLFGRFDHLAAFDYEDKLIRFSQGGHAVFDTYYNALSLCKWNAQGQLDDLGLKVMGEGLLEIRAYHALPERSWELVTSRALDLKSGEEQNIDLSSALEDPALGLLYIQVKALSDGALTHLSFTTNTTPETWPSLTVSITTFKREEEVEQTVGRLSNFLTSYEYADKINVLVVDNGQSAEISETQNIRYLPNDNLGGAGGFARGLLEAEKAGASHVLFTDDDASFSMESLHRTYIFLALAKDSRTAVAGAMITNTHKWSMWENGAIFDKNCRPQFMGTDLRKMKNVFDMEVKSANFDHPNLYGGWWFFAFPIEHAKKHPFPFFVRGDDISFSLANDFKITTINGVVSFQDDFAEKESPMTIYLDVRNHIAHHISMPHMEIGRYETTMIPITFALRNLVRFQYETAEACMLAWEDVMSGIEFFPKHKDMSDRRALLKTLIQNEAFKEHEHLEIEHWANPDQEIPAWKLRLYKYSLNGHLFPVGRSQHPVIGVAPQDRTNVHMVWGKSQITYLAPGRRKSYTVRFNRFRGLKLVARLIKNAAKFSLNYNRLLKEYQEEYPKTASKDFWQTVYKDSMSS